MLPSLFEHDLRSGMASFSELGTNGGCWMAGDPIGAPQSEHSPPFPLHLWILGSFTSQHSLSRP